MSGDAILYGYALSPANYPSTIKVNMNIWPVPMRSVDIERTKAPRDDQITLKHDAERLRFEKKWHVRH